MACETRLFSNLFAENEPTRNGLTRPKAVRGHGVKMVNMGELFAHPRLRNVQMERVPMSESEAERFLLIKGDLLFARQSLVLKGAGKCSIFLGDDEPVTFESHVTRVRLDPRKADPSFYYYYLQSHHGRAAIRSIVEQGAGASGIRGSDLGKLDVLWHPVDEQRAIARILGTLDDKIELNRLMNETLEAIARAIFKSWFVDFDPVRARAEGREPAGMDAETAALFPDSFEETETGMVPREWKKRTLSEFSVLNPEVWKRDTAPDQIEYIDLSNTKRGIIESTIKHQWKDAPSRAQRVLRAGDSILGTVRPGNGSYALISEEVLTGSTGFAVLRPVKREFRDYVYLAATAPANIERLSNLADGAAYPAVSPEMIMSTQVVKIPDPIIKRFSHLTCPLLDKIAANCKESSTLATLRDVLLPMLISGKIMTNDVEDFLRERCS